MKAGLTDMFPQSLTPYDLFVQALEEAAAQAAEEERRRLQTQTELQDRYRTDLEKEKLVGPVVTDTGIQQVLAQLDSGIQSSVSIDAFIRQIFYG